MIKLQIRAVSDDGGGDKHSRSVKRQRPAHFRVPVVLRYLCIFHLMVYLIDLSEKFKHGTETFCTYYKLLGSLDAHYHHFFEKKKCIGEI